MKYTDDFHAESHEHVHETLACDGEGHQHHHHSDGSCCCEQHAKEFHGIDKPMLARLVLSAGLYLAAMLLPVSDKVEMAMLICAALIAGYDIIWCALKNLLHKRFFDEYFLMSFAAIAAFLIGEYEEAAAVFVLYRIGAFCQAYAIRHSRRKIIQLTGDTDLLDQEDKVSNRFISRFSRIYTPIILLLAVIIVITLPLIWKESWHDAIYRALTFLVLACPCAIVISVPLAYFAGIGAASKNGLFFHDSSAVDFLAEQSCVDSDLKEAQFGDKTAFYHEWHNREGENTRLVITDRTMLPLAIRIAKKTRAIALENIWFTVLIKLSVLVLSVFGVSALWFAVFADSGVTILVVLNALRAFLIKNK